MKKCKIQGQVTTLQIPFTYNRKSTNFSTAYLRKGRHTSVNNFKFQWNAVGIVPNLSFCFFPFFFTDSLSVIVCEGQTKEIRCESISKIRVLWANYGRLHRKTCPHSSIKTIDCRASTSLTNVRSICQGKTACTLESNSSSFGGDPCKNTFKYLLVGYKCENWRIVHTFGSP